MGTSILMKPRSVFLQPSSWSRETCYRSWRHRSLQQEASSGATKTILDPMDKYAIDTSIDGNNKTKTLLQQQPQQ
jgi:hypothetical protein